MGRGFDDIYKYFIVDMFYYDNLYQKEHNPYYFATSIYNQVISTSPSSSTCDGLNTESIVSLDESSKSDDPVADTYNTENSTGKEAWKLPSPPDIYPYDFKDKEPFHIGGAYWTRSCALILYYHKWFNDTDKENEGSVKFKNLRINSSDGIQIVEFRDSDGTLFHHLEYLEGKGCLEVDLNVIEIKRYVPDASKEISIVAEDGVGNILKSKLNVLDLS